VACSVTKTNNEFDLGYEEYKRIITAIKVINTSPFVMGVGTFVLDKTVNPWVVLILDDVGNALKSLSMETVIKIADDIEELPPPGIAIDIEE
jgi:hypothetical protein